MMMRKPIRRLWAAIPLAVVLMLALPLSAFADRDITNVTLDGGSSVTVGPEATISATVYVTTSGSDNDWRRTSWKIGTSPSGGGWTCVNTPDHTSSGNWNETFNITAPSAPGTYNVYFRAYPYNSCNYGDYDQYTLSNSVVVKLLESYQADCATQEDDFDEGDTVCMKGTGLSWGWWRMRWFAPSAGSPARSVEGLWSGSHSDSWEPAPCVAGTWTVTLDQWVFGWSTIDTDTFNLTCGACTPPEVTDHPDDVEITYGEDASFTVAGTNYTSVQWQFLDIGWVNIAGATSETYNLTMPDVDTYTQYRAVLTGECGDPAYSDPATLTVTPKNASVTANNKSKTFGDDNPTLDATVVGEVAGGDAINYTLSTTAGKCSDVGDYPIEVTLGSNPNYNVTTTDGTLTINQKDASVTANDKSKTYGEDNPTLDATVVGEVSGCDSVNYTLSTTAGKWSPVGNYPIEVTLGSNPNYNVTKTDGTLTIVARDALVRYIGQLTFVTSGSSSTTAQVMLTASMQDPTGIGLVAATIDFIDTDTGAVLAEGIEVSPVAGSEHTGTANAIVTLSSGQYGAETYLIRVVATGNYDNEDQDDAYKTAVLTVITPADTNQSTGGGKIETLATAAGTFGTSADGDVSFSVGIKYNKSGKNLQGRIMVVIPQADGSIVYVKSNRLSSMLIEGEDPKTATIYTKSSIYRLVDGTVQSIDGNVSLRMDIVDDGEDDQVGFTVLSSKDSELYYSNNWLLASEDLGWRTVPQELLEGSVQCNN